MSENRFNIRVYGIHINEKNEILLSDEYMLNTYMTKFPGGGLEFGEGPIDCLLREAIEEFGQEIEIINHIYTTDYFQPALFYENMQLISIYYQFRFKDPIKFKISEKPFDFPPGKNGSIAFRWEKLSKLTSEDLTFPIDKKVLQVLKNQLFK
jgi:ADP-ribose pyrophosphatase YjhB (NUDIX family)